MRKLTIIFLTISIVSLVCCHPTLAQEVTAKQKRQVKSLAKLIDKAGRLYKSNKLQASAKEVFEVQEKLLNMAATANADLTGLIEPEYDRLKKAHQLLADSGVEVGELTPLPEPLSNDSQPVSFIRQVTPIIVSNCGRCHVNRSRGEFSAKNFDSLMASLHISAGRPDTSRLIEAIAEGSMPPNGQVATKEIETLKLWIRQGARFDGNDPARSLNEFAGAVDAVRNQNRPQVTKPTGSETVSFGLDVAPILIESCSGCHIGGRRNRGNLNMSNFARMLRGGDSGSTIKPGSPDESLLVKRLRGIDSEIMPPNKKLDDKKIEIIAKWISESGSYDGKNPQTQISTVVSVAKANSQSHEQLTLARDELAVKNWQLIMSVDETDLYSSENFRVIGNNVAERLEETADFAENLRRQIVEELRSSDDTPFVKGKATIYVFEKRYDLNELGMMLVGKDLPKQQTGRWDYSMVDAYSAVLLARGTALDEIKPQLTQQLAALHIASMATDVPRWFSDGAGYLTAARILRKNEQVKRWDASSDTIVASLEQPAGFATGKLNEFDSGLAGYYHIKNLKRSGDFNKLLKMIRSGYSFSDAFATAFGSPPEVFFRPPRRRGR